MALVVIGIIIASTIFLKRRRRRRDEEDEVYFEKYQSEPRLNDSSPNLGTIPGLGESTHDLAAVHARADAYPDRAIHHGWTAADMEYNSPQEYGVEYPPGTAYAAAQSQHQGHQYQYAGQTGTAYSNANQGYGATSRTSPGPHPFADPNNVARRPVAPPVSPGYARSMESHHTAYSGTTGGY